MNRGVIIYGTGTIGRMLYHDSMNRPDFEISCFAAEEKYLNPEGVLLGIPLINIKNITQKYSPVEYDMIVAVGGYEDMRSREII
jgi:hypothetical protein